MQVGIRNRLTILAVCLPAFVAGPPATAEAAATPRATPVLSVVAHRHGTGRLRGHRVWRTLLTASVRPELPPEPLGFVVQRHARHGWRTAATGRFAIRSGGTVRTYFLTNRPGRCRVRLVYEGDSNHAASTSPWRRFRVGPRRRRDSTSAG